MLRGISYESVKADGMFESKKGKRYRSAFTTGQINYLEKQFERCPYIGSATRKEVSNLLNIPERAIKIWFQNRRMKEKKEVNNKEYNINRNNITNDMEFAKDSLNNLHSSQSVNDHQCSLQSITKYVDRANCSNYYNDATFAYQNKIDNLKQETIDNHKPYKYKGDSSANVIKKDVEKSLSSEPANFIKYNLDKGYNNKNFVKYIELSKKNISKSKVTPKTTPKSECFRDSMLSAPSDLSQCQDLPQDLSARTLSNVMIPQNQQGNIQLSSAYIPFCNRQDVCVAAGNVIWKPVSVLPAISPNSIPVTIPERSNMSQNNPQKCKCNCNCNSRNGLNYNQGLESQPQYVIAIPYNNSLNILR